MAENIECVNQQFQSIGNIHSNGSLNGLNQSTTQLPNSRSDLTQNIDDKNSLFPGYGVVPKRPWSFDDRLLQNETSQENNSNYLGINNIGSETLLQRRVSYGGEETVNSRISPTFIQKYQENNNIDYRMNCTANLHVNKNYLNDAGNRQQDYSHYGYPNSIIQNCNESLQNEINTKTRSNNYLSKRQDSANSAYNSSQNQILNTDYNTNIQQRNVYGYSNVNASNTYNQHDPGHAQQENYSNHENIKQNLPTEGDTRTQRMVPLHNLFSPQSTMDHETKCQLDEFEEVISRMETMTRTSSAQSPDHGTNSKTQTSEGLPSHQTLSPPPEYSARQLPPPPVYSAHQVLQNNKTCISQTTTSIPSSSGQVNSIGQNQRILSLQESETIQRRHSDPYLAPLDSSGVGRVSPRVSPRTSPYPSPVTPPGNLETSPGSAPPSRRSSGDQSTLTSSPQVKIQVTAPWDGQYKDARSRVAGLPPPV